MGLKTHIGMRVHDARVAAGKSQSALAKHLGVSRASVIRFESGEYGLPSDRLVRIARWLGVEPADLLPKNLKRGRRVG